ncbi:hypothetical protein bcgnr5372_34110 [Bacillus luti]|nr:hypothetical protein [Bacillus cereus]HDR8329583.1 hypothetical protein [Bacillus cereus]HDR8332912.1 hypothetical protein [Bacillus cereus]
MFSSFEVLKSNVDAIQIPPDVEAKARSLKRHHVVNKIVGTILILSLICMFIFIMMDKSFEDYGVKTTFYIALCTGVLTALYARILDKSYISKVIYPLTKTFPITTNIKKQKMDLDVWNNAVEFVEFQGNSITNDKWITLPTNFGEINFSNVSISHKTTIRTQGTSASASKTIINSIYDNCFAYCEIDEDIRRFEIRPVTSENRFTMAPDLQNTELNLFITEFTNHFNKEIHIVSIKDRISIYLDDFKSDHSLFNKDSQLDTHNLKEHLLLMYSFYSILNLAYEHFRN